MSRAATRQTPRTSDRMLQAAARLFAHRGFAGTSMEEIGAACGMSGPAVYKHFPSKSALLAQMLLDISRQLVAGSRVVIAEAKSANEALVALIEFHTDFALNEPDLISVQDRDLGSLDVDDNRQVRRLQREYVETWASILRQLEPDLAVEVARVKAHAVFGLLNSTAHSQSSRSTRATLIRMASDALKVSD